MSQELTNIKQIPKWIAVFLVVEYQFYAFAAICDSLLQTLDWWSICLKALKESAVSGNNFRSAVSCYFDESVRREYYGVVCFSIGLF